MKPIGFAVVLALVSSIAATHANAAKSGHTTDGVIATAEADPADSTVLSASDTSNASDTSSSSDTSSASDTSSSSAKLKLFTNKTFQDNSGVTDTEIKAQNGSLSHYSAQFDLTYYGPPVGDLSNPYQPNPDGSVGYYGTALSGGMAMRYRLDGQTALNFGTGVSMDTPFHHLGRFDVRTPYISLGRMIHWGHWQLYNTLEGSVVTTPEYRDVGQVGGLGYQFSVFRTLGFTRWSVGTESSIDYFVYNRPYILADRHSGRYFVGLYPTVKYRVTDKLGLYTSYALSFWNARKAASPLAINTLTSNQRLGVDYAFARDIYFAPYLSFYAQNFSWASTTVNFSTIFSVL